MNFDYVPVIGKKDSVPARVGMMSLVGVGSKDFPLSFGNYFSFSQTHDQMMRMDPAQRVWNFWAENLKEAKLRFLSDGMVDIIQYNRGCIILDKRIPEDWYHNKLCYTGGYLPDIDEGREIYDILGDPTNEFEQFTDPVSYYAKRGSEYNPETGIVKTTVTAKSRQINAKWTMEPAVDMEIDIDDITTIEELNKILKDSK